MIKNLFTILFVTVFTPIFSQTWTGKVIDKKGESLPFVNVYFEGTSTGTTTNMNGEFSVTQPQPNKDFVLIFQFVGLEKKKISLAGKSPSEKLRVTLQDQALLIPEVTVAAYKKDPAYYIIKQAQKKRKYHLKQVDSYSCKVYMKGTTSLLAKPDKLPGIIKISAGKDGEAEIDSMKMGIMYLQESILNVSFSQKDGFKEEMIASKVSGSGQSFSWNRAQEVLANFYDDRLHIAGLNERGFVSPIASDAMLYYDYKLVGTFKDEGQLVNTILVIPKRKSDLVFAGTIYIRENLWNIHSLNLKVNKESQVEFVDSISINQSFSLIDQDIFMPLSLQMTYHFGLFGFRASYDAIGNITDYELGKLNIQSFAKNQVFAVNDSANKQDSAYWNKIRPVVLNDDEARNIYSGDSLKTVKESKPYLDSLDKANNKFRLFQALTTGYTNYNRYDSITYDFNGLLSSLQYSSVDGPILKAQVRRRLTTALGDKSDILGIRYGFVSQRPGFTYEHKVLHNKINYKRHWFKLGSTTVQINDQDPAPLLGNSFYNFLNGRNFAQFYQKSFAEAGISSDVANGVNLNGSVAYTYRHNLFNTTTYNLNHSKLLYAENLSAGIPTALPQENSSTVGSLFTVGFGASFIFKQKFASYPNRIVKYGSKYPKLNVNYKLGIVPSNNTFSANTWNYLEAEIFDHVRLGMIGASDYRVTVGGFAGQKPKNFADYKHFAGNQTVILRNEQNAFQNLPYYAYSTNSNFIEVHYQHHFYGFLLNKIPLIKKLKWKETAGLNYLYSESGKNYLEFYAGIDNLFRIFRVHFVSYYQQGMPLKPALRLGLRLN